MMTYIFRDSDPAGIANYDIGGAKYKALLDVCFHYAHSVSFYISPLYKKDLSDISESQLPVSEDIQKLYPTYAVASPADYRITLPYQIKHFVLSPQVQEFLRQQTDHLWGWTYDELNKNPDDICFFRSDKSVFLASTIHNGECRLYPKEHEDVSAIIDVANWSLEQS